MATIINNVTIEIINKVNLFILIMQQHVIENEIYRKYAPLTTNKQAEAIYVKEKNLNDFYLDHNNSNFKVLAKTM